MDKYPGYSGNTGLNTSAAKTPAKAKSTRTRKLEQSTLDAALPKHAARATKLHQLANPRMIGAVARPVAAKRPGSRLRTRQQNTYLIRG